ncbi:MAG: hypothetical protein R3190_09480 [Thermoanaerobaculia bacterium]|nr:hypothetical protein [Thermoanaerobaculia bacterium]
MAEKSFRVRCPDCASELVIDAATGEILYHRAAAGAPADGRSMEELLDDLEAQKNRAEDIFEQERAAMKDRDRLLAEKFEEAMKRAEDLDPDTPPPNRPFDFD